MRTIKIGFYKHSKSIFGKLIRFKQSFSYPKRYARYSHVELVLDNWISFSSSEQDWGVRYKEIIFNPDNWDFIELEVSNKNYDEIVKFCNKEVWNAYDWVAIFLSQMLNINKQVKWAWYCSEIVTRAIQIAWYVNWESANFVSPAKLAYILEWWDHIIN